MYTTSCRFRISDLFAVDYVTGCTAQGPNVRLSLTDDQTGPHASHRDETAHQPDHLSAQDVVLDRDRKQDGRPAGAKDSHAG